LPFSLRPIVLASAILFFCTNFLYAGESNLGTGFKESFIKEMLKIERYRPNYIVLADDGDFKLQLSLKKRINYKHPLYFAYTQRSFWDVFAGSSPFDTTNYNPEFFYILGGNGENGVRGWSVSHWRLGAEHESNGRGGEFSRGWNTVYIEPTFYYRWGSGARGGLIEGGELSIAPRFWYPFLREDNNSDIIDYYGYGELVVKYTTGRGQVALIGRKGAKGARGNVQIDVSYRFLKQSNLSGYLQFWSGDGESLLNYNKEATRVLVGIMFTRW